MREIARRAGLAVHDKKDSTGICFIGERPFREFLNRYLPDNPGDIRTPEGRLVGRHHGLMFYTIGQRQGLGIGGNRDGAGEPWYVAAKDVQSNRLIAVQGHDHPALLADRLTARDLNWISGMSPHCNWVYSAKTRYRQKDAPVHPCRRRGRTLRDRVRRAAMGGHARPVRGALREPGVPGRRHHRVRRAHAR